MNRITLILVLVATLIAQPACARVINVAPNAAVSLTQALALLKDPTLRMPSAHVGASAAGEPAHAKEPFALITNGLAGTASCDLFGKVAA